MWPFRKKSMAGPPAPVPPKVTIEEVKPKTVEGVQELPIMNPLRKKSMAGPPAPAPPKVTIEEVKPKNFGDVQKLLAMCPQIKESTVRTKLEQDRENMIFVAKDPSGKVVGHVILTNQHPPPGEPKTVEIASICSSVKGVGHQLAAHAEKAAREKGYEKVTGDPIDTFAKNWSEKMGYSKDKELYGIDWQSKTLGGRKRSKTLRKKNRRGPTRRSKKYLHDRRT